MLDTARALETAGGRAAASSNEGNNAVRRPGGGSKKTKNAAPKPALPPRKSRRIRELGGERPKYAELADGVDLLDDEGAGDGHVALESLDDSEARQLSCDEWAKKCGVIPGPAMNGHFSGWVNPEVREQLGIAGNATEAWEQNGGGKFDRKPSKGESAKEFARRMLKKNPNAYFYRHNPPGEDTWHGDWGEDEIQRFVEVAKKHGCGDKWGLFASWIPHRVGYQCSAAYRHVIIPRCLLRDDNFRLTQSGEAVWCGGRGGRGGGGGGGD